MSNPRCAHARSEGYCKRNVRLKIVVSGCDQCVWPVGVVAGYGHRVGH